MSYRPNSMAGRSMVRCTKGRESGCASDLCYKLFQCEHMNNNLDNTLAALADPTRRHVVELLRERPRRAGELAAACAMSGPAMSRHLRVLRASGLVEVEVEAERSGHDARLRIYQLRPEPFVA